MSLRGLIKEKAPLGLNHLLDDIENHPNRNVKANYRLLQFYKETVKPTSRYYRYIISSLKDIRNKIRNQYIVSTKRKQTIQNRKRKQTREEVVKATITSFMNQVRASNVSKSITVETKDFKTILNTITPIPGFNIFFNIGGEYYTLTQDFKNRIESIINEVIEEVQSSSDQAVARYIKHNSNMTIRYQKQEHRRRNRQGAFFPYYNNTSLDLSKYGIFKDAVEYDKAKYTNCIELALRNNGIDTKKHLYNKMNKASIPLNKLKDLAIDLKIHLDIVTDDGTKHHHFNKEATSKIKIGLAKEHYFSFEKTQITSYALKHYEDVKHLKNFEKITRIFPNGKPEYTKKRFIDSFNLVRILLENKETLLREIPFDEKLKTQYYEEDMEIKDLHYSHRDAKLEQPKKYEKREYDDTIYFDSETTTDGERHEPYLICYSSDKSDVIGYFKGSSCKEDFLNSLKDNTLLIAHNLSYDIGPLMPFLTRINMIKNGKSIKSCKAVYFNKKDSKSINLSFKDSLALIPNTKLSQFPRMFGLDSHKEIMPYKLYKESTITSDRALISDALVVLKEEDHAGFIKNIDEWNLRIDEEYFNKFEYSRIYCNKDVELLKKGYQCYKQSIMKITNIDIDKDNMITLPQLSYQYMFNQGCFDDVVQLAGVPQHFISKACVGGRVMCVNNEKIHCNDVLNDFDAVSLYPSAMIRMEGFPKGRPKVIEPDQLNYEFLSNQSEYFVEIMINKVNKKQDFPLISYVYDGKRNFTNEPRDQSIVVDKTTLEDMIEYHQIDYTPIRGYYFNKGFNNKINNVMKHLFEERLRMKKEKNPIQEVYKLLMNSGYGKLNQKPIKADTKIFTSWHRFGVYISRNYNFIKSYYIDQKSKVITVKVINPINNHYNRIHCGCGVLSTSKRIMSEVMGLAKDLDIKIYYTDTDSMHIEDSKIDLLGNAFKAKYNRDLIGEKTGQFHVDFKSDKGFKNPKSVESYFLGKKIYIDKICENGIDSNDCEYHIRMKGISNAAILNKEIKKGTKYPPLEQFKHLYNGGKIKYDLLLTGESFKHNKDLSYSSNKVFNREVYPCKNI